MKTNKQKKQNVWCDSTIDIAEFRKWDIKKQLKAIAEFARIYHSFHKSIKALEKKS